MDEYIWYILLGLALLGVLLYSVINVAFRQKKKALEKIRSGFGVLPTREYTEEEFLKIRSYFDYVHKDDDFAVDDITWSDLHLDEVFASLNQTYSSVGEEELYRILREPVFDDAMLAERDRVISFFSENERERTELQYEFARIGRTKKVALVTYLNQFQSLKLLPDLIHYLPTFLLLIAVGLCFLNVPVGILAIIMAVILNLYTYYRMKSRIEPWYVSLSAMAYLVNAACHITGKNIPEIESYLDTLRTTVKPVISLKRDMKWLGAGGKGILSMDVTEVLMDYFRMMTHIDFIKFNHMVKVVLKNEKHMLKIMHTLGFLEAMIAVSSYRALLPFYTVGQFDREKPHLSIRDGYHVLIRQPVANSITVDRPVLLTGSNASGKSTFLRMTALAVLLGETVATVPAHELKSSYFRVFSSMALSDDLQKGESYFIVEIKSLKRIMDALSGEIPILSFVDEVLRGTNTVERVSASSQILKKFAETGSLIFAATHDIELTRLLSPYYENYHFEEQVEDDTVRFDYILKSGEAKTRNAIKLLKMMGYAEQVIEDAEKTAKRFTEDGVWELS